MLLNFIVSIRICLFIFLAFVASPHLGAATPEEARKILADSAVEEDATKQIAFILKLAGVNDPVVQQGVTAWRQGGLFLYETNSLKQPFFLDTAAQTDGKARAIKVVDGKPIQGGDGKDLIVNVADFTPVDTNSKLRKALKTVLDLFALSDPNPKIRRDAVTKLGQEQNPEYLPYFEARVVLESDPESVRALTEAIAITKVATTTGADQIAAINELKRMTSITSLALLQEMEKAERKNPKLTPDAKKALGSAIFAIEEHIRRGNLVGTAFRGVSSAAVLLIAALGLAITFGLMGVINMAHGEVMTVGAYTAFMTQNLFAKWFGSSGTGFDMYFIAALLLSFFTGGIMGLVMERLVIRFLYKRPLESLLATWGVSLVLQQLFRQVFGSANVQVNSPSWMSGSFIVSDVLFAYNRLFVIGFGIATVIGTYLLLTKTSLGLQIRAVMQNRTMASCIGVRTDRINMLTFGFGSGLAGMAGACLSQIGNVGPGLGQLHIVDCFMVVVLGGVGNLVGTVMAAFGVGVTDQILQPWLGAVMGKICVLVGIILFLQWRPAGLFASRGRSLED